MTRRSLLSVLQEQDWNRYLEERMKKENGLYDCAMVLEGGATRGIFTAGALDFLMEKEVYLDYVVGVSAGCCNAVDYVSRQIGRTKQCLVPPPGVEPYMSIKSTLVNRTLFDMDLLFDKYAKEMIPFDFEAFFDSQIICEITASNCFSARPAYFRVKNRDRERLLNICKASSSMPIVSRTVEIDGLPYLDGGITDSVPVLHVESLGYSKQVVILTQKRGYRKKPTSEREKLLIMKGLEEYPAIRDTLLARPQAYNATMDLIDNMEAEGKIFVLRPVGHITRRTEHNPDKLLEFYYHGYRRMEQEFDRLMQYLDQ